MAQFGYNFEYDATALEAEYRLSIPAGKDKKLFSRPVKKLCIEPLTEAKLVAQGVFLENDASLTKAFRMHTAYLSHCKQEDFSFDFHVLLENIFLNLFLTSFQE